MTVFNKAARYFVQIQDSMRMCSFRRKHTAEEEESRTGKHNTLILWCRVNKRKRMQDDKYVGRRIFSWLSNVISVP